MYKLDHIPQVILKGNMVYSSSINMSLIGELKLKILAVVIGYRLK